MTINEPHSRACGIRQHEHGRDCHENCPTCGGGVRPATEHLYESPTSLHLIERATTLLRDASLRTYDRDKGSLLAAAQVHASLAIATAIREAGMK